MPTFVGMTGWALSVSMITLPGIIRRQISWPARRSVRSKPFRAARCLTGIPLNRDGWSARTGCRKQPASTYTP